MAMEMESANPNETNSSLSTDSNEATKNLALILTALAKIALNCSETVSPERQRLTATYISDLPIQPTLVVIEAWLSGVSIPESNDASQTQFFPKPVHIRTGVEYLTGTNYKDKLERNKDWILTYLRRHGLDKKKWGERLEEYRTPEGRLGMRKISDAIPTPELSPLLERTMTHMGRGEFKHGLALMYRHPMATTRPMEDDPETLKTLKSIESQFEAAFARALREDR